jgi:hypothetical protein
MSTPALPESNNSCPMTGGGTSGFSSKFNSAPPGSTYGEAEVEYAEGGSIARIKPPDKIRVGRKSSRRRGRPKGARIKKFSWSARLRMRELTASISKKTSKALLVTLTYPEHVGSGSYYVDPETAKRKHLEALKKRFERRYGPHCVIWRMEFQGREVPHFHLLIFFDPTLPISKAELAEMQDFFAKTWWDVCGRLSEDHLKTGTRVERPRSLVKTMRYMAKAEALQGEQDSSGDEGLPAGKRWGVWRQELLPITWKVIKVALKDAFQMRRFLRRLLGLDSRSAICNFRVFVCNDPVKKILSFLGYPP